MRLRLPEDSQGLPFRVSRFAKAIRGQAGGGEYLGSSEKSGCLSRVCGISGGQRTYSGYQMCVSNHKPFWKWEASACVTDENMRLPEETGKPE